MVSVTVRRCAETFGPLNRPSGCPITGIGVAVGNCPTTVKVAPLDPAKRQALELDRLFGELHSEKGKRVAPRIEQKIWSNFMSNVSPTAEVLLGQATLAMEEGALDTSETMLNTIIGSYPEYVEALNKRATVYYKMQRYDEALEDFAAVLEIEPRHFGALAGRGMVFNAQGKLSQAVVALREALEINPGMEVVKAALKKMQHDAPDI